MNTERILSVIRALEGKSQALTVNNIVVASLFTTGGTLAGQEKDIQEVLSLKERGIISLPPKTKIDKSYTHFLFEKESKKIVNGWDYKGCDEDEIKHYSRIDMKDNDQKVKDHRVMSRKDLKAVGIDPFDSDNWKKYNY